VYADNVIAKAETDNTNASSVFTDSEKIITTSADALIIAEDVITSG